MKKTFLLVAALLLAMAPLAAQSVTVTSPNGGESWALNSSQTITWIPSNAGSVKVDIILRRGEVKVGVIKSQVALSDGAWTWAPVGTLENGTIVAPRTDYTVRIRNTGNTVTDDSNGAFAISGTAPASQPTIKVDYMGIWMEQHTQRAIPWTYTNAGNATVNITLRQGNPSTYVGDIKTGVPLSAGTWNWNDCGRLENGTQVPDRCDYCVRITIAGTSIYSDGDRIGISDKESIVPTINITTPDPYSPPPGGVNYAIGKDMKINWWTQGLQGTATLWLEKKGGEKHLIASGISLTSNDDQSFPWKAGQYLGGTAAAGTGYSFRMRVDDPTLGPYVFESVSDKFALSAPVTLKEPYAPLPNISLKSPRLEVTDLGLAPNLEGFGIVFTYKNVGEGYVPKASDLPVKPDYRVVHNGGTLARGSLFIPAFSAPPGWVQRGYFGGFIVMPKTYGDFQSCVYQRKLTFVHINENMALGNKPDLFVKDLKDLLLKYCYDLKFEFVRLEWKNSDVDFAVSIEGKIPANKGSICVDFYGLRKPFQVKIPLKPGQGQYSIHRHLSGCEIPKEQRSIFLQVTARMMPLESGNERVMDIDLRNNVQESHLTRPLY